MKFLAVIIAYLLIGFVLSWGILQIMEGKYWVLAIGTLAYLVAFIKFGCLPSKDSH